MNKRHIIRAWKDPKYRRSLSPEQLAQVPAHPSAIIELDAEELQAVAGAGTDTSICSCIASLCTPCPPKQCF